MTKFRHGFKAQCEKRSVELRKRLGLDSTSPLSASALAQHFGTTVWSLSDIEGLTPDDFHQLTVSDGEAWSAFTLGTQVGHLIVFNPSASAPRINSVCMHELSHIILGHEMVEAAVTDEGHLIVGRYEQQDEDEANWLAGALLLPRPAVLFIRQNQLSDAEAMDEYMVSQDMLTWRIRMTGVDYQIASSRRKKLRRA